MYYADQPIMNRNSPPPAVTALTTPRGAFACLEEGTGEPVIFIHGSLGSLFDFSRQMSVFAKQHRCIAYSRRYHSPNPPPRPGDAYTIDVHAGDLEAVIRGLKASPAHLVGSSWGGYAALAMVLRSPELVLSLVLVEPPVLPLLRRSPAGRICFDQFYEDAISPAQRAFERGEHEEGVRKFVDGIAGKRGSFDLLPPKGKERLFGAALELRAEFSTPFETYMPLPDHDGLSRMTTPVLLVEGARSPKMFHLILDELELAIPATERVTIPRSGHAVHVENAPAFNEAVLGFLRHARDR